MSTSLETSAPESDAPSGDLGGTRVHHPPQRRHLGFDRYALIGAFVALIIGFGIAEPSTFLSVGNLSNILGSQTVLFVLVLAVLIPTVMGDFDLSLGASLGLSSMTIAVLNVQHGIPVMYAALAGVGVAMVVGIVNSIFVVYYRNDPFIITLGTMSVATGIIYVISGNNTIGVVSTNFSNWIFINDLFQVPLEFYYGLAIFVVIWYTLSFTPIGQKALVVGQSREVARLSGVKVDKMRAFGFVLASVVAAIAGWLYAGTQGSVDPTAGSTYILPAYAAVFLGATAIRPGRINSLGSFIAVYFLATGTVGLELLGAADYYQQIFYGAALVVAITIPKVTRQPARRRVIQ
ncbi:MAG TPA: ABC transporter permease [Acidimicrobiales bacterium]|nr:ABC transporter permease [Acidimicrobiales bacterium]